MRYANSPGGNARYGYIAMYIYFLSLIHHNPHTFFLLFIASLFANSIFIINSNLLLQLYLFSFISIFQTRLRSNHIRTETSGRSTKNNLGACTRPSARPPVPPLSLALFSLLFGVASGAECNRSEPPPARNCYEHQGDQQ